MKERHFVDNFLAHVPIMPCFYRLIFIALNRRRRKGALALRIVADLHISAQNHPAELLAHDVEVRYGEDRPQADAPPVRGTFSRFAVERPLLARSWPFECDLGPKQW